MIGEENGSDAVVVPDGGHRQHGGKLGGELALEALAGAEALGAGEIDDEHHRELSLLDVPLDVGAPHAGRDIPVDAANLVARLVLAHFSELHPLPFEYRPILTGEERVHEAARAKLEELHLAHDVRRDGGRGHGPGAAHHGRRRRAGIIPQFRKRSKSRPKAFARTSWNRCSWNARRSWS